MSKLLVRVVEKLLEPRIIPPLTSGSVEADFVEVNFVGEAWSELQAKAVFWRDSNSAYALPLDANNRVRIPWEVLREDGEFFFGLVGYNGTTRIATSVLKVSVLQGTMDGALTPTDLSVVFDEIIAELAANDARMEELSKAIGNLGDLETTNKSSLVAAINEAATKGGGYGAPTLDADGVLFFSPVPTLDENGVLSF